MRKEKAPAPEPVLSSRVPALWLWLAAWAWGLWCLVHFASLIGLPAVLRGRFVSLPSAEVFSLGMILRTAGLLAKLALFWLACLGAGSFALKLWEAPGLDPAERLLVRLGLGAGALGLGALGAGLAGLLQATALKIVLGALGLAGLAEAAKALGALPKTEGGALKGLKLPLWILAALALYELLAAAGPSTYYDGLVYHLALPDLYLRRGAIVPLPRNAYSGIPAGIELLYLWLLPFDAGGSLCQLLHWSLGLWAAAGVLLLGRRWGSPPAGAWAAAIFYSSPMTLLASGKPGIELGTSFYLALFLLALEARAAILAGVLAGLVLGTKYQAAVLIPALVGYLLWERRLREAPKILLAAALLAAPWYVKNAVFYRNPVYPLFDGSLFASTKSVLLKDFMGSAQNRDLGKVFSDPAAFLELARHPLDVVFPGRQAAVDNTASLALAMSLPLLALCRARRPISTALVFSALLWLPMSLASRIGRFSMPALVPLSLAAAWPIAALGPSARKAMAAGILAAFALDAFYTASDPVMFKFDLDAFWGALKSGGAADDYLAHNHRGYPNSPYPAYRWIAARTDPRAKVLFFGESRTFHLERDREAASLYAAEPLAVWADASATGEELYQKLASGGITHLFINFAEYARLGLSTQFSASGGRALKELWDRRLKLEFMDRHEETFDQRFTAVYRLLGDEEARAPHQAPPFPFKQAK